jgi:23S rRNA pseudouridine1911/1915/1917 synthase
VGQAIVGDVLYGGRPLWGMQRQALHATRLEFVHPVSGRFMSFHAPLPDDMQQAAQSQGVNYNTESLQADWFEALPLHVS